MKQQKVIQMHKRTSGAKYISVKRYVQHEWIYDRVTIRTIDNRPIWHLFKEFINSLDEGQQFTRKDLFHAIYIEEAANALRAFESTIDHYRVYCSNLGYIDHIGRGLYCKRIDIPINATTTLIESHAYNPNPWQDWFSPKHIRRDAILRKCQ